MVEGSGFSRVRDRKRVVLLNELEDFRLVKLGGLRGGVSEVLRRGLELAWKEYLGRESIDAAWEALNECERKHGMEVKLYLGDFRRAIFPKSSNKGLGNE